eukprot:scaffold62522_cov46-Attheya_sp.AAC.1
MHPHLQDHDRAGEANFGIGSLLGASFHLVSRSHCSIQKQAMKTLWKAPSIMQLESFHHKQKDYDPFETMQTTPFTTIHCKCILTEIEKKHDCLES